MKALNQIFERLGLTPENGLYITADGNWKGLFSNRVERLITNVIEPDAIFCIDKKPLILFFEGVKNKQEKLKEIWNFNESPIVIIAEANAVEIYNGYNYITSEETLQLLGTEDQLTDFSYFELVTGKTWERHQADFSYKKHVDFRLLENIKAARNLLITGSDLISKEMANSLIGKVIFVRYLIDRKVNIDFDQKGSRHWTNGEFCELLNDKNQVKGFFRYLKGKFNGDLFPISEVEIDLIPKRCFSVIIDLLTGNEVGTGQRSLFDLYDFSIIPVEFISNVYELFIGQNEQEEQGAYYTPLFLVDYILAETVQKKLDAFPNIISCKVLDPACGSGIFLVETLRKIIEQFQKNNPDFNSDPELYKESLKTLACENIFGVDKDPSAVNVAIFSIYLTLLDYQNPSNIETFQFPLLLEKNFFVADFFEYNKEFNSVLKKQSFDFILGNPPWKRGHGEGNNPKFVQYISNRKKKEKGERDIEIEISSREIAQAFVFRVDDFCTTTTKIALIVTSKILYNSYARGFREYLLDRFVVNKVFELAAVRKEVFDKSNGMAVGPATVLFYHPSEDYDTDVNIVEHIALKPSRIFSLFKVFTIQRNDYKQISQKQLKDYDYLWKVLVYGNYLDFNLIKRLRENFDKASDIIYGTQFLVKQGIKKTDGEKKIDVGKLVGWDFLDTSARGINKEIQPFFINPNHKKWELSEVGYAFRNPDKSVNIDIFSPPVLLTTEGVDYSFRTRSAILNHPAVFTSSITAVKGDLKTLLCLCGILNSSLFPFFLLHHSSYLGIEREQTNDKKDKFAIPFKATHELSSIVEKIQKVKMDRFKFQNELLETSHFDLILNDLEQQLNSTVFSLFRFGHDELDLMDYALNVTIPMIMKNPGWEFNLASVELYDNLLLDYVSLFLKRFNVAFEARQQKLVVQIHLTNQIIGLFFKLIPTENSLNSVEWMETGNTEILSLLKALGNEKITDRLFIQKDVRGFEKDGFYIVKPNEKRLWHKAIGYLDVNEFADAILANGKNKTLNVQ